MTDDQLRDRVISQLHWDNRLATAEVAVEVHNHEVELRGVLPTYCAQQAAVEDVMRVEGVLSVKNGTTIQHPTAVGRYSDDEIREMIEEMLFLNANIDSEKIVVDVQNGVVTLAGSVDALWKKIRVEELILDIMHVVALTNNLSVQPRHHYDDEDIATGILRAFERINSFDKSRVAVAVDKGVAHIGGMVPRIALMHTLIHTAQNTRGVRDVVNELEVEK